MMLHEQIPIASLRSLGKSGADKSCQAFKNCKTEKSHSYNFAHCLSSSQCVSRSPLTSPLFGMLKTPVV